jgi:SNF2 family DNA or RNA helicase
VDNRQNSVEELYSLIKFLQIRPLNDWITFNDQIAKPVKSGRSVRAMKRLQVGFPFAITLYLPASDLREQVVLKAIMLRRRKDHILNGQPVIILPERIVKILECQFSDSEKDFYQKIESKMAASLDKLMAGENKAVYTSVLVLLLRLRQGNLLRLLSWSGVVLILCQP